MILSIEFSGYDGKSIKQILFKNQGFMKDITGHKGFENCGISWNTGDFAAAAGKRVRYKISHEISMPEKCGISRDIRDFAGHHGIRDKKREVCGRLLFFLTNTLLQGHIVTLQCSECISGLIALDR